MILYNYFDYSCNTGDCSKVLTY